MARADELTQTALERRCLAELRDASGEVEGPMERHCVRCFMFVERMAARRGLDVDREVALCAAFLHDIGIYPSRSRGGVYTDESGELAKRLFAEAEADPARAQLCADACAYHHARSDQTARGAEVELLRLADQVEVFGGLRRHGLTRDEVRAAFDEVPRAGLYSHIAKLTIRALRDRPRTLPKIFKR
ncbi:MAG TPA: HD domain-containing protein [Solirubrobacterales bacterium]|nr:HD domain-containing protein [Solirubrobacterales bacterium]